MGCSAEGWGRRGCGSRRSHKRCNQVRALACIPSQLLILSRYHAQLVSIISKLPNDVSRQQLDVSVLQPKAFIQINLQFSYTPAFFHSALPISFSNLAYERAAVLFNLAALYSQLAANEDRSSQEGVKRASVYFQAGLLNTHLTAPRLTHICTERRWNFILPVVIGRAKAPTLARRRRATIRPFVCIRQKYGMVDARPSSGMRLAKGRHRYVLLYCGT